MVASWIIQVGCYFGLLKCSTPPGVWPANPTVIPSTTATQSTGPTATPTDSLTSTTLSPTPSVTITSASSSMSLTTSTLPTSSAIPTVPVVSQDSVSANILVIAKDDASANSASSGLNGYGIPFTKLIVPQVGVELPALNSSSGGNFGGIVVAAEVSYDYGGDQGFQSALTTDQWNQLYAYQLAYGVRMVQYDVYPGPKFGASAVGGGCCSDGVEQLISFSDTSDFPTAGLKTGAGVSTQGLWHYPAQISSSSTTKEIAQFDANSVTSDKTTAAVINNFDGRQQMVFFIGFDTTWSATSNYLQHAWITWITRGLHAGYRRVYLNTQIDDMLLESDIYKPSGTSFRVSVADMEGITAWVPTINAKMNPGSDYFVEIGYNGNGNIEAAASTDDGWEICNGGGIQYDSPPDTPLEWKKPLGTGTSLWPATPTVYDWTEDCVSRDDLTTWWKTPSNRDKYAHISHTFSHLEQNNATYSDVYKEISFNQAWLKQSGIDTAKYFTDNGIIPPAITGLHNGDALRAWWDRGITNCVGDNTRPALMNQQNDMWPYFTNVASDGFDGMQVNPRFATRIYYNCDTPDCTVQEWIDTSTANSGDFETLLETEKGETMRHLFGLHHDPYMFHQANLRNSDITPITINGETAKYSIFQAWVEIQVQEFVRLVDWPILTITHQEVRFCHSSIRMPQADYNLDVRKFPRPLQPRQVQLRLELQDQRREHHWCDCYC